ncbi:Uncharacterised protein [Mycobacteroides abscessus subsp. abscessus]|nr:Uncharacterised protein [Mycobacteroides abscessus subsp. abscessus]
MPNELVDATISALRAPQSNPPRMADGILSASMKSMTSVASAAC